MTTLQTILVTVLIAIWLIFSVVFLITAIQSWIYDRKRDLFASCYTGEADRPRVGL